MNDQHFQRWISSLKSQFHHPTTPQKHPRVFRTFKQSSLNSPPSSVACAAWTEWSSRSSTVTLSSKCWRQIQARWRLEDRSKLTIWAGLPNRLPDRLEALPILGWLLEKVRLRKINLFKYYSRKTLSNSSKRWPRPRLTSTSPNMLFFLCPAIYSPKYIQLMWSCQKCNSLFNVSNKSDILVSIAR